VKEEIVDDAHVFGAVLQDNEIDDPLSLDSLLLASSSDLLSDDNTPIASSFSVNQSNDDGDDFLGFFDDNNEPPPPEILSANLLTVSDDRFETTPSSSFASSSSSSSSSSLLVSRGALNDQSAFSSSSSSCLPLLTLSDDDDDQAALNFNDLMKFASEADMRLLSRRPLDEAMYSRLRAADASLRRAVESSLLSVGELVAHRQLCWRLNSTALQDQLLRAPAVPNLKASFVSQPFPAVFAKRKGAIGGAPVHVKLVLGANVELAERASGTLVAIQGGSRVFDTAAMDGAAATFDARTGIATFGQLRLAAGTGGQVTRLACIVEASVRRTRADGSVSVERASITSSLSLPFVVIVHPKQMASAEHALLRSVVGFDSQQQQQQQQLSWHRFANALQFQFCMVTRQDPTRAERPLSRAELDYARARFFSDASPSAEQFDTFMRWFSECLRALRYSKHVADMWRAGLIAPLCSRATVEQQLLAGVPHSTFLVRFSERHPGLFAVSYVPHVMTRVPFKHFLVRDMGKLSLPEYLASKLHWASARRVHPSLAVVRKEDALAPYLGSAHRRTAQDPPPDGYDDE
jgi:SH2 domain